MKPTIAIGDIHGLDYWKGIVENHSGCRFVFLGDYLDPYEYIPHNLLLSNLCDIIELKRNRQLDIILLLGNHDLHYFCSDSCISSRFDYQIADKASRIFIENFHLFQYAYQEGDKIFTHAGISNEWFENDFHGDIRKPIPEQLNIPTDNQVASLCRIGQVRGGQTGNLGGIFWADKKELDDPLHGFTQIVGHNKVNEVTEQAGKFNNKIIFCDCLWNERYLFIED